MSTKPDIDRMAGPTVGPDGITKAFTVEEQWARVARYYEFLTRTQADEEGNDPLGVGVLEDAWALASETYEYQGRCIVERGAELRSNGQTPLAAMFFLVGERRSYPPPELLLALEDCWRVYMNNVGRMTLERAFLGPPVRRAGPYAMRSAARRKRFWLEWQFRELLAQGRSRKDAAEELAKHSGVTQDPDSIERSMRAIQAFQYKPEK